MWGATLPSSSLVYRCLGNGLITFFVRHPEAPGNCKRGFRGREGAREETLVDIVGNLKFVSGAELEPGPCRFSVLFFLQPKKRKTSDTSVTSRYTRAIRSSLTYPPRLSTTGCAFALLGERRLSPDRRAGEGRLQWTMVEKIRF